MSKKEKEAQLVQRMEKRESKSVIVFELILTKNLSQTVFVFAAFLVNGGLIDLVLLNLSRH